MKIGEFAKKSGVTVKTLLHYDKINLLKPSSKTESGYRIYCEEDFLKLQQITTLKFIGLSLGEIKNILNESGENLENMISIQKKALEEKKKHIEEVINVFDNAQDSAKKNGFLDVRNLIDIIKITNMEKSVREQYKNDKNLKIRTNLHSYNTNKVDWDKWCFNNISFVENAKVLELGCGTGEFWRKNIDNLDKNLNICISDFSESMLKIAKANLKDIKLKFKFKEINAENIPFKDNTFDIIIAQHMIYFVPNMDKALKEIKRVLRPGGKLYVTANSKYSMLELNELLEDFSPKSGLNSNGYSTRFELENGKEILGKHFKNIHVNILNGKIIIDNPNPIVSYKASTIQGEKILVGDKRKEFKEYLKKYIKDNGNISITTKVCMFKCEK